MSRQSMRLMNFCAVAAAFVMPLSSGFAQAPVAPAGETPAVAQGTPSVPEMSLSAAEVVRLAEGGGAEDVLLAYVQNSTSPFNLTADQILYLRDIGVSSQVTAAMLNRDAVLRNQPHTYTYNQQPYPATVPPPGPQPEPAPAPAPAPQLVTPPLIEQPAPVYVSSPPPEATYFYNDLSPYGTWVNLDGVGWCWQPRVVVINHGWQPYCDGGHWVYTDAGWFWQSDYSWGWAAFHYGRWQRHDRCGWVWTPDRVWGPAWVVWRSEGDHCGWAPLPPHADFDAHFGWRFNGVRVGVNFDFGLRPERFTFVRLGDFDRHDLDRRRLAPTEVTRIYNHTTIINNYQVRNNTIVNEGIRADRVAAATHNPIHQVAIRDVPANSPRMLGTHNTAEGEVAVYRPQLRAPAHPVNMVAQKVDDRHPVIQHTPLPTANTQYRAGFPGIAPGTANSQWRAQPQPQRNPQAPSNERASPVAPRQQTPATYPAARNNNQPSATPWAEGQASSPSHSPPTHQSAPPAATPYRPPTSNVQPAPIRPAEATRAYQYPSQPRPGSEREAQPVPRNQGNQFYEPKGGRQAAEVHSLPPANNQRQDFSPGQQGNAPGGQSRKNNQ